MKRRSVNSLVLTAGLGVLGACRSDVAGPVATPIGAPHATQATATRWHRGQEHFDSLADIIPSFGGYFFENGKLVAYVADAKDDVSAKRVLGDVLRARQRSLPRGTAVQAVEIRRGTYGFRQLADWRDSLDASLFTGAGVVFTDVDEVTNHVTIGVDRARTAEGRGKVAREVVRLGLPADAITVVETAPMVVDVAVGEKAFASDVGGTLTDPTAPLRGGVGVQFQLNDGMWYGCTLGFLMDYQGARRFVTNSHCSKFFYGGDGESYFEGSDPSYRPYIGSEWHDSHGYICGGVGTQFPIICRESDSNISTSADPSAPGIGTIARTTFRNGGGLYGGNGSLTIDASNPYLTITGHEYGVYVGDQLDKIGARTGWTWGTVQRTCVTIPGGQPTGDGYSTLLTCQHFTNYVRDHGDSGAPVFMWYGNTAVLYGVHRGATEDGTAVYSGFRSIEQDEGVRDQGQMLVTAPQTTPPPTDPCTVDPTQPGCSGPPCGGAVMCARVPNTGTVDGVATRVRRPVWRPSGGRPRPSQR